MLSSELENGLRKALLSWCTCVSSTHPPTTQSPLATFFSFRFLKKKKIAKLVSQKAGKCTLVRSDSSFNFLKKSIDCHQPLSKTD